MIYRTNSWIHKKKCGKECRIIFFVMYIKTMSLPNGVDYASQKHDSLVVDSALIELQPMNGRTFNMQSHIILEFPNRPFSFYDTESAVLSMTVTNNDGHKVTFDSTLACLIQRMSITNAGAVLSDCVDYNKVHHFLLDYGMSREERATRLALTSGNKVPEDQLKVTYQDAAGVIAGLTAGAAITKGSAREGQELAASGGSKNFSTNLYGSIWSANKYIPAALASPLTVNLYLDAAKQAFLCADTAILDSEIVITDVKLQIQSVKLEPSVYQAVSANGFQFMCEDFATSRSTLEQTSTDHTVTLPFRYSKLKSYFALFQKQADLTAFDKKSVTSRVSMADVTANSDLKWKEFYLSVAGTKYPAMSIQDFNRFPKLLEGFDLSLGDEHQISISKDEAEGEASAIGMSLEAVRNKSDLMSGMNTTQSTVVPVYSFTAGRHGDVGVVAITHIGVFDSLIQLDPLTGVLVLST